MVVFILLFGQPPFYTQAEGSYPSHVISPVPYRCLGTAEEGIKASSLEYLQREHSLSDSALDFLSKLLQLNPRNRLTAREALQHPWINSQTTTPLDVRRLTSP